MAVRLVANATGRTRTAVAEQIALRLWFANGHWRPERMTAASIRPSKLGRPFGMKAKVAQTVTESAKSCDEGTDDARFQ